MKFDNKIPVFGDTSFRGDCPSESAEAITFFNKIRREYPTSYGLIATHIRNEGARTHQQAMRQKAEGLTKGAPDIIILDFYCELKRKDHTKSKWQDGQQEFLLKVIELGGFACVALGYEAAFEAFTDYKNKK